MDVLIVDFEDSFTLNIAAVLDGLGVKCRIIKFDEVKSVDINQFKVVLLGPGPGHPDEYKKYIFPLIEKCFNSQTFLYGICLGHQLIHYYLGYELIASSEIVHGQSIELNLNEIYLKKLECNNRKLFVQRYNSLGVRSRGEDNELSLSNEVMMNFKDLKYFSCQFHPESVGTSFPELFFKPITKFLYN